MSEINPNMLGRVRGLFRKAVNEYVVEDKTFRISVPASLETIKYFFGHSLSEGQLSKLAGHGAYIVMFVKDSVPSDDGNVPRPEVAAARKTYEARSRREIRRVSELLGSKPLLDV